MESLPNGIKTGFTELDQLTGGLRKSDLILLASTSDQGNTALAMNIATNLLFADSPQPVLLFSMEMKNHAIMSHFIAAEAKVDLNEIRNGSFKRERWQDLTTAAARFAESPLHLNSTCMTLSSIISAATDLQNKLRGTNGGLGLIVIDQLRYMQQSRSTYDAFNEKGDSRKAVHDFIDRIEATVHFGGSQGGIPGDLPALKQLAKDLDVAVLVLHQLPSKIKPESRRSQLVQPDPFRGFDDHLENSAADMIAFIDLDFSHRERKDAQIAIAKNAHGETGSISLRYDREYARFTERPV